MSDTPSPPVPRPRRRLWRRLLRWMVVLIFAGVASVAGGLWWAWKNQTRVARLLLDRIPLPLKIEIGELDGGSERVIIRDLKLTDKSSGELVATLPEVVWKPEWRMLQQGHLGELDLGKPVVTLSQKALASFLSSSGEGKQAAATLLHLARLSIRDASLKVEGSETLPGIELKLNHELKDLRLGESALPHVGQFEVAITEAMVDAQELVIPSLRIEGSVNGSDGSLHLRSVELQTLELKPGPALVGKLERLLRQDSPKETTEPALRSVQVDSLSLPAVKVDTTALADCPKLVGELAFASEHLSWAQTGKTSTGAQRLTLSNIEVRPPSGSGLVRLPKVEIELQSSDVTKEVQLDHVALEKPEIEWTADFERWVSTFTAGESSTPGTTPANSLAVLLKKLVVTDATLRVSKTPGIPYEGRTSLTLQAEDLRFDDQGLHSAKPQKLELKELVLAEHPADREKPLDAFLNLKQSELVLVPDDWNTGSRISRLVLDGPKVKLLPDNTTFLKPAPPDSTPSSTPAPSGEPLWERIRFDHLALTGGQAAVSYTAAHRVDVDAALEIKTEPFKSMDGNLYYTIVLKNMRINAPELSETPVTNVDELSATVEWPALWKTRRVESLRLRGGELDVNDVLTRLTGASPTTNEATAPPPAAAPAAKAPAADWKINRLAIADTYITLHRLAPGLPPVKFAVNLDVWDMPLQPKQLVGRLEPQKVELSHLSLRSPFDPLREVAVMNTIFIHFTLDGLLAGRIDRVEVLNPTLNVGEDLFWYVDYYRKYAAGELPADEPAPRIVSTDKQFAFDAAGDINVAPPGTGGWTVEELAVSGGKLVIAPKGVPLPGIPRPFPFSFVTKLEDGKFQAELEIPSDTYTWENLKLEFQNLRGHVLFNLPHKQVSNNLTETFRVDVIRYKQLHIEDCFLTVTYDAGGIYGQFGGEAYEGYVKGAFNIYNDTSFTWDGWIAGTGVRTTEITQKMTPTYLLLDGKVDATVIALGNMSEVYQTDISFTNTEPGKFSITTLNSAIESIPTDIEGYLQDITRIGIETVRDFDYDKAEAKARFYGREGRGTLKLSGPHGSRNIEVNVYDHRWKVNKKPQTTSSSTLNASE